MFDRDYTVDVNPHPDRRAIPLRLVKYLAHQTHHPVFATGNQHLRREALIPGVEDAADAWEQMNDGYPEDEYEDDTYFSGYKPSRENCVRLVRDIHPDHDEFFVFDDIDLSHLNQEGIIHYYPWNGEEFIRDNFDIPDSIETEDNQPENAKDNLVDEFLAESNFLEEYDG